MSRVCGLIVVDAAPEPCIPGPGMWRYATLQVDTGAPDRPALVVSRSTLRVLRPFGAYVLAAAGCAEATID